MRISSGRMLWTILICWFSLFFFLWPGDWTFPAGAAAVWTFVLVPLFFPRCRFRSKPLVTPQNWLLLGWFFQLVLMPITVRVWGPLHFFLPHQPSWASINLAMIIIVVAYWSYSAAFHFGMRPAKVEQQRAKPGFYWPISTMLIIVFGIAGVVGLAARYKSIGTFITFLTSPASYISETDPNGASFSVVDVIGQFLSPLLGFSLVMFFCRLVEKRLAQGRRPGLLDPLMLLPVALAFSLYGYNRANFVFPIVALAAVVSLRIPTQRLRYAAVAGTAVGALVLTSVIYRFSSSEEHIGSSPNTEVLQTLDTQELFVLYGQAPQYMAALLEAGDYGVSPRWGLLSVSGILGNIPKLGKPLRPLNGYSFYARATHHPEENPAFAGEIFLDFSMPGVIIVYAALGLFTAWLQRRVLLATHALEIYVFQTVSIYLIATTLLSVEVLGQFGIYHMTTLYIYLAYRGIKRRSHRRHGGADFIFSGQDVDLRPTSNLA